MKEAKLFILITMFMCSAERLHSHPTYLGMLYPRTTLHVLPTSITSKKNQSDKISSIIQRNIYDAPIQPIKKDIDR